MNPVPPRFATSGQKRTLDVGDDVRSGSDSEEHFANAGEINPDDGYFEIEPLKKRRRGEGWLREDGDPTPVNVPGGLYGQQWLDKKAAVRELLHSDKNYQFVQLVSGYTHSSVEKYYEVNAIEDMIRKRLIEAQQNLVVKRRTQGFMSALRAQLKNLEERLAQQRKNRDEYLAEQRDWISGRAQYEQAKTETLERLQKLEYILPENSGQLEMYLSQTVADNAYADEHAERLFDFITRSSVVTFGRGGFMGEAFRRQIENLVDRTCAAITKEVDRPVEVKSVEDNLPATSRLALYFAALRAVTLSQSLLDIAAKAFAENYPFYAQDLQKLADLVFSESAGDGLNYLDYEFITITMAALIRKMQKSVKSELPEVLLPVIQEEPAQEGQRRTRNFAGMDVIVDIDEDALYYDADEERGYTDEELAQFRDTPHTGRSPSSDVVAVLLEILKPMFDAVFPYLFYADVNLGPDSILHGFGGWTVSPEIRRLLDFGVNPAPSVIPQGPPAEDLLPRSIGKPIKRKSVRRTRRSIRAAEANFGALPSGASHNDVDAYGNYIIGEKYSTFPGLLLLAIGIFEHSIHKIKRSEELEVSTTNATVRHLMLDGFSRADILVRELVVAFKLDAEAASNYFSRVREYLIKRDLLPYAALVISTAERITGIDFGGQLVTQADLSELREYLREPNRTKLTDAAFRIYETRLSLNGTEVATAPSVLVKTKSNEEVDNVANSADSEKFVADNVLNASILIIKTEATIKKLRDDLDDLIKKDEKELSDELEQGFRATNIIDPRVALSVANTGVVQLNATFLSALASAHEKVRTFVDGFRTATQAFLQENPLVRTFYAQLVANEIHQTEILFPDVYRHANALALQLRREQTIINHLRRLAREMCTPPHAISSAFDPHALLGNPVRFVSSGNYRSLHGYFR